MKQGSGRSFIGGRKIEPRSKAINPGHVADIGLQQVRFRDHKDLGKGYTAPMAGSHHHPRGSQGKH
jgi:hypothetical protein